MPETTEGQRDTWASVAAFGDFAGPMSHQADKAVAALCRDVNALEDALEQQAERHDSACRYCDDAGCPCGGTLCNCGAERARAVLAATPAATE